MTSNRRVLSQVALVLGFTLLATFSIEACSSDDRPSSTAGGSSTSSTSGSAGTSGTSGSSSSSSGSSGDDGGSSSSSSSSTGGPSDAGEDVASTFVCAGDASISGDAGALPTSCSDSASCSATCTKLSTNYRLGVAQTGIDCLRKLDSCTAGNTSACIATAIDATCADPTAKTFCTPLVKACDPNAGGAGSVISEGGCEGLVASLNNDGRAAFKSCLEGKISGGSCPEQAGECFAALQ